MNKMKKLGLMLSLLLVAVNALSQSPISQSQAEKDLYAHKARIEKLMLDRYGITEGLKDCKISHIAGPYRRYSSQAKSYGWNYVSDLDQSFHLFSIVTPKYDNGNEFEFELEVIYDSYEYGFFGARKAYGKFEYSAVSLNLKEFKGNELNEALLLDKLNDLSNEKPKAFNIDKYKFYQVDSVKFKKIQEKKTLGWTGFEYQVDLYGKAVETMIGFSDLEYESVKTANIHATLSAAYILYYGEWKIAENYVYLTEKVITNEKETNDVPAYKKLDELSLVDMMGKNVISDSIPNNTYRKANDIKRLILRRFSTQSRDEFIQGEFLTTLFDNDKGNEGLNHVYAFKKTMKEYLLDSVSFNFTDYSSAFKGNGYKVDYTLNYNVKRELDSKSVKAYKGEVSKDAYQILKYKTKGYVVFKFTVLLKDNKFMVDDFWFYNAVKYNNGGETTHPVNTKLN